jgi:N,N'-diacetyllegionaminate synthase
MECLIIAEAGVNHNGSLELGKKLIEVAAKAKADFVKFQSFKAENLVTQTAEMAEYQKRNIGKSSSQFEMLKKLEMSDSMMFEFIKECQKQNISFLSTPFDEKAADELVNFVELFKVPSGELTNLPFLRHLASLKKPIILSTGMATLSEVEEAVVQIRKVWNDVGFEKKDFALTNGKTLPQLTVLHCTTSYPTPMEEVNLNAMSQIKNSIGESVGYSDHTLGIEVPIAARSLGAEVIEKHFTLDRSMEGPDHAASLEPHELAEMVSSIRNIEKALGDGEKRPSPSEIENIKIARKSLFYNDELKEGTVIEGFMLSAKRPGTGVSPMQIDKIIGKALKRNVKREEQVALEDFH